MKNTEKTPILEELALYNDAKVTIEDEILNNFSNVFIIWNCIRLIFSTGNEGLQLKTG